ncbi:MAG: T9SS type A sorting domain-containing protein [Bacteroidales bacterium]|jgi:hypothetical protein|nr:T9SS type A sorting domain-containing protein [Bacteroidales bacterium]
MRKIIITLVGAMAMVFAANAQQFTNGDFESWTGSKPNGWKGLEMSVPILGNMEVAPGSVAKSTDSHNGSAALKLQPKGINPTLGALLGALVGEDAAAMLNAMKIPAFITNGTIDVMGLVGLLAGGIDSLDITALADYITDGLTINAMPSSIDGYLNFTTGSATDQYIIVGICFADVAGTRTPVGIAMYSPDITAKANYSSFSAPMAPIADVTPNELVFIAVVLSGDNTSEPVLLLDDLTIQYGGAGLSDVANVTNDVYPNPSTGNFTINCQNGSSVTILNMLGQEVLAIDNYKGTSINLDNKGMYFVKIGNGSKQITKKIIVK